MRIASNKVVPQVNTCPCREDRCFFVKRIRAENIQVKIKDKGVRKMKKKLAVILVVMAMLTVGLLTGCGGGDSGSGGEE
mgnify:CR=1 FL=1